MTSILKLFVSHKVYFHFDLRIFIIASISVGRGIIRRYDYVCHADACVYHINATCMTCTTVCTFDCQVNDTAPIAFLSLLLLWSGLFEGDPQLFH